MANEVQCDKCINIITKEFSGSIADRVGRLVSEIMKEDMIGCKINDKIKSYLDAKRLCPLKKEVD